MRCPFNAKTIILLIFFLIRQVGFSQNLYVLSVVNTREVSRPDRELDADKINQISLDIAAYAGFTRHYYDFGETGAFNPIALKQSIQKIRLTPCNQDMIWVHFSGYGRNDEESIYPALQMGDSEIYLRDIIGIIRQKRPKILLISIDSGNEKRPAREFSNQASDQVNTKPDNSEQSVRIIKPIISNPIPKEMGQYHQVENYSRLFKKFDGTKVLVFQSNSIGENAISNAVDGSYGLYCLEKAVKESINNENQPADWMIIKENYIKYLTTKSKNRQTPKVTIEVPLDKCKGDE